MIRVWMLMLLAAFGFAKELQYENLMLSMPKGFKVGYKAYDPKSHLSFAELVPKNESVNDWTRMLTVSIFYQNLPVGADEYSAKMKEMWTKNCLGSSTKDIANGKENGYEYSVIMLYCPKSSVTKKSELTWIKSIKGNDAFYTVQRSFSVEPSKKELISTMEYLKQVWVCDTRLGTCPKITKK